MKSDSGLLLASGVKVLDDLAWLPPYGESGILAHARDGIAFIDILFEDREGFDWKSTITFSHAVFFSKASAPGAWSVRVHEVAGEVSTIGIVEYSHSELAGLWNTHYEQRFMFRHYQCFFPTEGVKCVIIAESCELGEADGSK